jgi:hypothetical protein
MGLPSSTYVSARSLSFWMHGVLVCLVMLEPIPASIGSIEETEDGSHSVLERKLWSDLPCCY